MMACVIALLNQKGGVGKSCISIHLATVLSRESRVLLVDADPQHSALDWSTAREKPAKFNVIGLPKPTLHRDIPGIATGYDWVIIDGPPRVNELARSAIAASDLVVIPVQPSPFDVWAAQDIVSIVGECRISKPEIEAYFVVNRLISGTTLASEIKDAIAEFGLPLFKSVIKNRTEYAKSARYGLTACETDPGGIAATEIGALADEITELMTVNHG
jgi:chromosome partitioning protein